MGTKFSLPSEEIAILNEEYLYCFSKLRDMTNGYSEDREDSLKTLNLESLRAVLHSIVSIW